MIHRGQEVSINQIVSCYDLLVSWIFFYLQQKYQPICVNFLLVLLPAWKWRSVETDCFFTSTLLPPSFFRKFHDIHPKVLVLAQVPVCVNGRSFLIFASSQEIYDDPRKPFLSRCSLIMLLGYLCFGWEVVGVNCFFFMMIMEVRNRTRIH